jgi:phage gp16-like protein
MTQAQNSNRNAILGKIHIAKKQLKMDDGDYRAMIANLAEGKTSCKDCSHKELGIIMEALIGLGFKPVKSKVKLSPKAGKIPTQADKIRAMWIDLYQSGVVRNRGDDALQHFVQRLTKVDRVEWLNHRQAVVVITALTKMGEGSEKCRWAGDPPNGLGVSPSGAPFQENQICPDIPYPTPP